MLINSFSSNLAYDTGKPAVVASPCCPQPCRSESPWLCPTVLAVSGSPANTFTEHRVRLMENPFKWFQHFWPRSSPGIKQHTVLPKPSQTTPGGKHSLGEAADSPNPCKNPSWPLAGWWSWLCGAWMWQESQNSSYSHSTSTYEEKEKIKSWPSL